MLELYCEGLFKEFAVQGDVREGVKGSVRAEVRGVRNARQNEVSPDNMWDLCIDTDAQILAILFLLKVSGIVSMS